MNVAYAKKDKALSRWLVVEEDGKVFLVWSIERWEFTELEDVDPKDMMPIDDLFLFVADVLHNWRRIQDVMPDVVDEEILRHAFHGAFIAAFKGYVGRRLPIRWDADNFKASMVVEPEFGFMAGKPVEVTFTYAEAQRMVTQSDLEWVLWYYDIPEELHSKILLNREV